MLFIANAIQKREIQITMKKRDDFVFITLLDNAGGIDEDYVEKVFEPYFTTKHTSSGTGLGLFMSKMICEQAFNGSIKFQNTNNGVIFTLQIPLGQK